MDQMDRLFAEVDANIAARCARVAKENGFATYEEYTKAQSKALEEMKQANRRRAQEGKKLLGQDWRKLRPMPKLQAEPKREPRWLAERCRCTGWLLLRPI